MSKIDQTNDKNTTCCFRTDLGSTLTSSVASFDKRLFDIEWARAQGLITGQPEAGRGNTYFLNVDGDELVLREYLRGGLVRHVNSRYYLWQGLQRTRAFRELHMLNNCIVKGLPVSIGYACKVDRHGIFYTASLITHKLDGQTFAQRLSRYAVEKQDFQAIGKTIARFHHAGIWHADLNAHNILINQASEVSLIDFDRACEYPLNKLPAQSNIQRLHRSLLKEAGKSGYEFNADGWATLVTAYKAAMKS